SRSHPHAAAGALPSAAETAESASVNPATSSASDVSGTRGRFKRMLIGETRWNRSAVRGSAASQTTNEIASPFAAPRPQPRTIFFHQGSNRRSSRSSGLIGPNNDQPDALD